MSARLKALQRLAALYNVLEHANGVTLDQARGALHEVEARIRDREDAALRLSELGNAALREGELQEWLIDQSQIAFTQWNADALEALRREREAAMRQAAEVYQASRMQLEQMQSVVDEVRASVELEKERSEQRSSDDRYLSRQRWEIRGDERRKAHAERAAQTGDAESFERSA